MIVNKFLLCEHGHEFCHQCLCDYRSVNDGTFDDLDPAEMLEYVQLVSKNKGKDLRKPLSIAGKFIPTSEQKNGDTGALCQSHKLRDCEECFDWKKMLREQGSKKGKAKAKPHKIADREQILALLQSMGVNLPSDTKLPKDALEKRLTAALSMCQSLPSFSDKFPLDPSTYPAWKDKSALDGFRMGTLMEAYQAFRAESEGRTRNVLPSYEHAFADLRQKIMYLANMYDEGQPTCVLQDEEGQEAICVRVLGVHALNDKTPVMSVVYYTGRAKEPKNDTYVFIYEQLKKERMLQVRCTVQEQALFRKLLHHNSQKLSPNYKPTLESHEKNFKISFLLPVSPLSQFDIGKLTSDTGCAVCGKRTTSRCTGCLAVAYCGPDCQRAHWKDHKSFCRAIRGGKWRTVKFTQQLEIGGQRMFGASLNFSSLRATSFQQPDEPTPASSNQHNEHAFLVKIQRPASLTRNDDLSGLLVYDRGRTFQGYITIRENPEGYREVMKEMGDGRLKVYRWAKRVGDSELNLCLDREPLTVPQW
ncbi:hypothetical protein K523DRAFT_260382 [Schizophyllum commune Tattone D]|nr:hypothetical protein K523DRAFT_260382 [Schizophyllum commune Tattone D]